MATKFPRQDFLNYIVNWIAQDDRADRRGGLVGGGISGSDARKLRRTIDSLERLLVKTYSDPNLRPGGVSPLWPVGVECYECLGHLRFLISVERQTGLVHRTKERETELLYVANLFSPVASIGRAISDAGGDLRQARTIAERIRTFRRKHRHQYLRGVVEMYFGFFKSAKFRNAHPGRLRKISPIGSRMNGLTKSEINFIEGLVFKKANQTAAP